MAPPTVSRPSRRSRARASQLASRSASVSHMVNTPRTPCERSALALRPRYPFWSLSDGMTFSRTKPAPASMSVAPVNVTTRQCILEPPVAGGRPDRSPDTPAATSQRGVLQACDAGSRPGFPAFVPLTHCIRRLRPAAGRHQAGRSGAPEPGHRGGELGDAARVVVRRAGLGDLTDPADLAVQRLDAAGPGAGRLAPAVRLRCAV